MYRHILHGQPLRNTMPCIVSCIITSQCFLIRMRISSNNLKNLPSRLIITLHILFLFLRSCLSSDCFGASARSSGSLFISYPFTARQQLHYFHSILLLSPHFTSSAPGWQDVDEVDEFRGNCRSLSEQHCSFWACWQLVHAARSFRPRVLK